MIVQAIRKFARNDDGAIAPIYALALFGLVAMAGVGFDYARLMALDTELQNAADQAALAAATQLDGQTDSITRAKQAATNYFATASSDYVNETRLSTIDDDGDSDSRPITQLSFEFWQSYSGDAPVNLISNHSDGSKAEVVQVTIGKRSVQYALTPIVGAIAGDAGATAMASMESAFCKVPPMMFCLPQAKDAGGTPIVDSSGNPVADTSFPGPNDTGRAVQLHMLPNSPSNTDYVGGIFGFLDFPYPKPSGVGNQNTSLGWNVTNPNCTGAQVDAEPGVRDTEASALNTRFDIEKSNSFACKSDGTFCPALNTTKNWVRVETRNVPYAQRNTVTCDRTKATSQGNSQGNGNNDTFIWQRAADTTTANGTALPSAVGYRTDSAFNAYGGFAGNKDWGFADYMARYHPSIPVSGDADDDVDYASIAPNGTRYEVYEWENADPVNRLPVYKEAAPRDIDGTSGTVKVKLYCEYPQPRADNGIGSSGTTKDRRVMSVAAVNCNGLNGGGEAHIIHYVDLFLITPANETGSDKAFHAEIIGKAEQPGTNNSFQALAKRKAVLIR